MKDNGKSKNALIVVIYILAFALGGGIAALYCRDVYSLILSAAGLVVIWVATSLFHECGHLFAAKASGFEIIKFVVVGFCYDKTKRRKLRFKLFPEEMGEITVIPKKVTDDGENGERYASVIVGGLIGHALATLVFIVVLLVSDSFYVRSFFAFFTLSLATLIINGVAGIIPSSDGSLLKEKNFGGYEGYLDILRLLSDGVTYGSIYEKYFDSENCPDALKSAVRLFELRREEELGNLETARLKAAATPWIRVNDPELAAEILFIGYFTGDKALIESYEYVAEYLDVVDEPYAQRLRLAKAKYNGDEAYFGAAYKTAIKACGEEYFSGDGSFNKIMIERLA